METIATPIADLGLILTRRGRSIIIRNVSHGSEMSNGHILQFAALTRANLETKKVAETRSAVQIAQDEIDGWLSRSRVHYPPVAAMEGAAYAYMFDEQARDWASGRVVISPLRMQLPADRFGLEALAGSLGSFALSHGRRHAYLELAGGFNAAVVRCSRTRPDADRAFMSAKYGPRVMRIKNFHGFMSLLASHLDNSECFVKDVAYSDLRVFRRRTPMASTIANMLSDGPFTAGSLSKFFEDNIEELMTLAEASAVFCAPFDLAREQERRGMIRLAGDMTEPIEIIDRRIVDLIEPLD